MSLQHSIDSSFFEEHNMAEQQDNWSSEVGVAGPGLYTCPLSSTFNATDKKQAYQNAASFVPKLATKVMQWLNPQQDDLILDVGCGGEHSRSGFSVSVVDVPAPVQLATPKAWTLLTLLIRRCSQCGNGSSRCPRPRHRRLPSHDRGSKISSRVCRRRRQLQF